MKRLTGLLVPLILAACGGGGGGSSDPGTPPGPPPPPPPPPVTQAEAFQLLNQASFGATEAAADDVSSLGVEGWIDRQMNATASLQLPYLQSLPRPFPIGLLHQDRVDIWFRNALEQHDQLRQRVA
ncbi:MAG: DUF1800 family protein, partial [Pseudomonadota bacterium]